MSAELMALACKRAETDALVRDLVAEVERLERLEDANADALKVLNRRLKAAEARLRELASAEPVAIEGPDSSGRTYQLIRRPEMPS